MKKELTIDYNMYQEELKAQYKAGESSGIKLMTLALQDILKTGGQNTKVKDEELNKLFEELKNAISK